MCGSLSSHHSDGSQQQAFPSPYFSYSFSEPRVPKLIFLILISFVYYNSDLRDFLLEWTLSTGNTSVPAASTSTPGGRCTAGPGSFLCLTISVWGWIRDHPDLKPRVPLSSWKYTQPDKSCALRRPQSKDWAMLI